MANSISQSQLSPFGQSALQLDQDFVELERVSGQLERLAFESDTGMEKAQELLACFGQVGMRIGEGVQLLAKTLDEARTRAEAAAQVVSERAAMIQMRQNENAKMGDRFRLLGEEVQKISSQMALLKKPAGHEFSNEEKAELPKKLSGMDLQMAVLIEESRKLEEDASAAHMNSLERNADSLSQTLQSARRKLTSFLGQSNDSTGNAG